MTANLATKPIHASVDTAALKAALDTLKAVVEKRNTIPILGMLHVTSDKGTLFLAGTDLDIYLTISLPANVEPGMNTTVPVHLLHDLVKTAPKGSITTLTPDENHMLVDFGGPAMKIQKLDAADFPVDCVTVKEPTYYEIPGAAFWNGLDATEFAISTEETRYYLNGVFLHQVDGGELKMASTDGHRLALQNLGVHGVEIKGGVILPRKLVKIMHKLMKGKGCPTELTIGVPSTVHPTRLRFEWGNILLEAKMIDGTFPDYQRVTPSDSYTTILAKIDSQALLAGVKQVSAVSSEKGRAVKLTFSDGNKLLLLVNNPDSGSATYELPVSYERLEPLKEGAADIFEIGFNGNYLQDILTTAGKGDVILRFQDAGSPAKILGARSEWYGVLMPMRV